MLLAHGHNKAGQRDAVTVNAVGTGVTYNTSVAFGTHAITGNNTASNGRNFLLTANDQNVRVGLDDFTLTFWFKYTSNPSWGVGLVCSTDGSNNGVDGTASWILYQNTNGTVGLYSYGNIAGVNNSIPEQATGYSITANAYHHIALCREYVNGQNVTRLYFDGVQKGTSVVTNPRTNYYYPYLRVGMGLGGYTGIPSTHYIDDLRLVIGKCLFPGGTTFTVPDAAAATNIPGTALLLHFDNNRFDDNTAL